MKRIMYEVTNQPGVFIFWCDGCDCCHQIWTAGANENSARWSFNGDVYKPTVSPSILVTSGNAQGKTICHSFIKDGNIQYLGDCTHKLAGQTVPLVSLDDLTDNESADFYRRVFLTEDVAYRPTTKRKSK